MVQSHEPSLPILIHNGVSLLWITAFKTISYIDLYWIFHQRLQALQGQLCKNLLNCEKEKKISKWRKEREKLGIQARLGENGECHLQHSLEHGIFALRFFHDHKQHWSIFHTDIDGLVEEQLHPPQLVGYGVGDSDVGCQGGDRAKVAGQSWLYLMIYEEQRGQVC